VATNSLVLSEEAELKGVRKSDKPVEGKTLLICDGWLAGI